MSEAPYARVAVAVPLADTFTYAVPAELMPTLGLGHVVLVPFGPRGETGYVIERVAEPGFDPAKVKPITRLVDPVPAFDARQLEFFRWIADYYLAPLGMVVHTALPSEVKAKVVRGIEPTEAGIDAVAAPTLPDDLLHVLREIVGRPGLTRRGLVRRLAAERDADAIEKGIDALLRRKLVQVHERDVQEQRGKIRTVRLLLAPEVALAGRRGPRQRAVIAWLAEAGESDVRELVAAQGDVVNAAIRSLVAAGVLAEGAREDHDGGLVAQLPERREAPVLNADQRAALDALCADGAQGAFLLHGVTGSGKTEVFLGAAEAALARGRQVLVLVPEIGLTPQLVGRFQARFGDGIAVLHSGLTGGERLAQWRRIRAGEAQVAVGARSALFAPFRDLGLVVVDEEHDDSYKQDDGVRYNARDLAVVLGRTHRCPVVLASATPALETWHNAATGRYHRLALPKRATARPVPLIELVDLTELDAPAGQERPLLAPSVQAALRETFDAGGKAIVLYNRRGWATMVECTSCGGSYSCPSCGVTMTLHRSARVVACHYCGLKRPFDGNCPACHKDTLEELGKGTERIEEVLATLFPDVPVGRMDADTTAVRGSHHRILEAFRAGETRLLVGTQIVAKGHDFPDVHTAVVVSADHGLRMPDFRSAERTFSLLVQTAGRAGRGEQPGRVFVQTWNPEHYVFRHLDDPASFYDAEQKIRATLRYPPFARLVLVRVEGADRRAVQSYGTALAKALRDGAPAGVEVLGPAPAALPRLVGRWRWQIVLRGRELRAFRGFLEAEKVRLHAAPSGVRTIVDVDPRHLM